MEKTVFWPGRKNDFPKTGKINTHGLDSIYSLSCSIFEGLSNDVSFCYAKTNHRVENQIFQKCSILGFVKFTVL